MISLQTPLCNFNETAPDFLLTQDGKNYTPQNLCNKNGLLVMFICNHCPYVQAILPSLVLTVRNCQAIKIGCVAIMSNNIEDYPEDSPVHMKKLALDHHFSFPYLYDESQEVAKKFGAICTPDFFGYNSKLGLQYRGRFDSRGKTVSAPASNDLLEAMKMIAKTGFGPTNQIPSIGCSIKWKNQESIQEG
ncbi:MAG: thioredoxin family protein [Pseudomonadota bacterium]|nr:thioredoxin family protein [Pseudomonadota bacterium]